MTPFPIIEKALVEVITRDYAPSSGKVFGELQQPPANDWIIVIGVIPGGSADELFGTWYVDVDVLGWDPITVREVANDIEPILLRRGIRATTMRLDDAFQNIGPAERPWDDDNVIRIGATYGFTARRSG